TALSGPYRRVIPRADTGGSVPASGTGMPVQLLIDLDRLARETLTRLLVVLAGELADLVLQVEVLDARQDLLALSQQLLLAGRPRGRRLERMRRAPAEQRREDVQSGGAGDHRGEQQDHSTSFRSRSRRSR